MTTSQHVDLAPQFPGLDTLRAAGAIAVLTTHAAFWAGSYTSHGLFGTLFARLDVGVAIFFVLSGFLLSRPHLARAAASAPTPPLGCYLWKRFLRIFPASTLTVVLALVFIEANSATTVRQWVSTLLLTDIYSRSQAPSGLTHFWSLSVEVSFYLLLPILMAVSLGRRRALRPARVTIVLLAMVALTFVWHLDLVGRLEGTPGSPLQWLPSYLTWFAVGIGLALVHVQGQSRAEAGRVHAILTTMAGLPGSCWSLAAGAMLLAASPLAGPTMLAASEPAETLTKNLLYAVVGGLLVLPGVFAAPTSQYARAMSLPIARRLGHISYGVFCIHLPVLHLVMWLTGYDLFDGHLAQLWLLTLLISLVAAELIYRLVEMPALRFKNLRLGDLRLPRSASPESGEASTPAKDTSTR